MFSKVLIANRGEIACRIARTLRRLGVSSVAVYTEPDAQSLHLREADEALSLGSSPHGYLDPEALLEAARQSGAEAVHPGYGFLSENADFAEACARAGLTWIGPSPRNIRDFGLKDEARALALAGGVPVLPGSGLLADVEDALKAARTIGFPLMLKSTAGGGGIGMQLCRDEGELSLAFDKVWRLSQSHFKGGGLILEKFVERARHVEVQIFGDGEGTVRVLGERDCSTQRRNQKVIEEAPAPGLTSVTRREMQDAAARLASSVAYASAGTVEFVLDADSGAFYFLEVNTRLQVEHGVTELVFGIDLVEWMLLQAAGEKQELRKRFEATATQPKGWAMQVRLYAENPLRDFAPGAGLLTRASFPEEARVETWVETGTEVTPYYDPMLAKLLVHGSDREDALERMRQALDATRLDGPASNLDWLRSVVRAPEFSEGRMSTRSLAAHVYQARAFEVLEPGPHTSVQDFPGRQGYWSVGIPPSGPMDSLSFRLANRLAGNSEGAPALELTLQGPSLRFHSDCVVAVIGATLPIILDGKSMPMGSAFFVASRSVLSLGAVEGAGLRAYLAVRGGLRLPQFLGSRATFDLGRFGGQGGRTLKPGDLLYWAYSGEEAPGAESAKPMPGPGPTPACRLPRFGRDWEIGVLYGPHGAPDFFAPEDIETLFSARWKVHHNSNRTGVRLVGPKPRWARPDGGEAGLHPSNIHDNAYAVGAVDFTGDMPILLGPDGPSLGGFVCPAVVAHAELWKLGQLRPGDSVRLVCLDAAEAAKREAALEVLLRSVGGDPERAPTPVADLSRAAALAAAATATATLATDPVLARHSARGERPEVCIRRAGDRYVLVEFGPLVLDLELRFHAQLLLERLESRGLKGIVDLTPGVRSLQIHYDPGLLTLAALLKTIEGILDEASQAGEQAIPSRTVYLPLSWDDEAIHRVIERYTQTVRPDAPWCPSNIEFIRRINGLDSVADVERCVFEAEYLVLGLGDVYLGAPVATPLDPRHRLVTTKYNPARTWTVENVVGIGGAYMCVYGMEGPGGYQLFGRTCQVWNSWRQTKEFLPGKPWLLRFFDRIRFYKVSHEELHAIRRDLPLGRAGLRIEEGSFSLRDYRDFLDREGDSIASFREGRRRAFAEERERWREAGALEIAEEAELPPEDGAAVPEGCQAVSVALMGSVLRLAAQPGDHVRKGDPIVILECMKTEFTATAPCDGVLREMRCTPGAISQPGECLAVVEALRAEAA